MKAVLYCEFLSNVETSKDTNDRPTDVLLPCITQKPELNVTCFGLSFCRSWSAHIAGQQGAKGAIANTEMLGVIEGLYDLIHMGTQECSSVQSTNSKTISDCLGMLSVGYKLHMYMRTYRKRTQKNLKSASTLKGESVRVRFAYHWGDPVRTNCNRNSLTLPLV
jgi:hypothetical protein